MSILFTLLIVLIIAGFVLWAIRLLPLDATIQTLIRGLVILIVVLYAIFVVLRIAGFNVPLKF